MSSHSASPAPPIATWKDITSHDDLEQMPSFDLHLLKAYLQRKYTELIEESPSIGEAAWRWEIQTVLRFPQLTPMCSHCNN